MVENQLYEAEAVIGILQSLPDESFRSAFREMAGDPIAGRVLQRIAQAPYGRFGPDQDQEYYETRESDNETTGVLSCHFHVTGTPFKPEPGHSQVVGIREPPNRLAQV